METFTWSNMSDQIVAGIPPVITYHSPLLKPRWAGQQNSVCNKFLLSNCTIKIYANIQNCRLLLVLETGLSSHVFMIKFAQRD